MNKKSLILATVLLLISIAVTWKGCKPENPVTFSEEALASTSVSPDGQVLVFRDLLKKHQGKKIVIDIWASWCGDCYRKFPTLKTLQKDIRSDKVVFVTFSIDTDPAKWKHALQGISVKGEHYLLWDDWSNPLCRHLGVTEIPTLIIIDENGMITDHDATDLSLEEIRALLHY